MTNPNDPISPLPVEHIAHGMTTEQTSGLTKRELLSAMMAQGMWANAHISEVFGAVGMASKLHSYIAEDAVLAADALIAALNAKPEQP